MSLNRLYELSRRSLQAQTARMAVAGQNVANADTPGYARRRALLAPEGFPAHGVVMRPVGHPGNGVRVTGFERMRDALLQTAAREAEAGAGRAGEEARLLGALEAAFGADGKILTDALGGFWRAWSDLADHPTDEGVRRAVLHHADHLAQTLRQTGAALERFGREATEDLGQGVERANGLLEEIAALTAQIRTARAGGAPDLAAEDRRDEAVRELASLLPITVREGPDGFTITTGGLRLLQNDRPEHLRFEAGTPPDPPSLTVGDTGRPVPRDGRLGGALRTLAETLPSLHADLDALAASLVERVNALHAAGTGLDGGTGRPLFDPAGTTALTVAVALTDPRQLAASADGTPGDNAVARAVLDLQADFDAAAAALAQGIGARLRTARAEAAAQAAVADHLAALEQGVSGVSLDEEMTRLIEAQQAFAAAARVLTTAEQMMETLLRL